MPTPNEPAESERREHREGLARPAGEVKTMEARVYGQASAESARIDGEIKTQRAEHSTEFRAVLEAVNALGAEMKAMTVEIILEMKNMEQCPGSDIKAMEERSRADMKAMTVEIILEMKNMEERLMGDIRLLKWGIGLILAFVVPTFVGVFTPQIGALLLGS